MDRKKPQASGRLSDGYGNNLPASRLQSHLQLAKHASDLINTSNSRRCLYQEQERQNFKNSINILLALESRVEGSIYLDQFQKAQMNNMLASVQSLVESLSIQYSDLEMPDYAYRKLNGLVESLENLVYSIIRDDNTGKSKYGIFQDRITNLSPSVSSRSIGGNYEDELIEQTDNFHINGTHSKGYYDNNNILKKSDDEDSEFDDEEISNDGFTNQTADIYKKSYKESPSIHNGSRLPRVLQLDGSSNPTSSFITPTRSTMQHAKGHFDNGSFNPGQTDRIPKASRTPFKYGGFNSKLTDSNLYRSQKLLISQNLPGKPNQFPARYQAAHQRSHTFL